MTTSIQVIDSQVLRDTLLSIVNDPLAIPLVYPIRNLVPLVGSSPLQYKIFWEHVPTDIALPYIVLSHLVGGRKEGTDVSNKYSDTLWKVVGHTANMETALAFANAISKLDRMCPVTTGFTGVSAVAVITEKLPIFDRYQIQNAPQFMVGGMYRLRLNLGAN